MGISKNGAFVGRTGNTVTYWQNGQLIMRTIGQPKGEPTTPQKSSRNKLSVVAKFAKKMKGFIEVGFAPEAKKKRLSPYNTAVSFISKNAVKGVYPNQEIDLTRVLLSMGDIPVNSDVKITGREKGLEFNWDPDFRTDGMHLGDNIMIMVFCPEKRSTFSIINGARRNGGTEFLVLPRYNKTVSLEVFTAFISVSRTKVSNSVYHGTIEW